MSLYISKYKILLEHTHGKVDNSLEEQRQTILNAEHLPVGTIFEVLGVDCGMLLMACKTHIMSFNSMDINLMFNEVDISHLSSAVN